MKDSIRKWFDCEDKKISQEELYLQGYKLEIESLMALSTEELNKVLELLQKRKDVLENENKNKVSDYFLLGRLAAIKKTIDKIKHSIFMQKKAG